MAVNDEFANLLDTREPDPLAHLPSKAGPEDTALVPQETAVQARVTERDRQANTAVSMAFANMLSPNRETPHPDRILDKLRQAGLPEDKAEEARVLIEHVNNTWKSAKTRGGHLGGSPESWKSSTRTMASSFADEVAGWIREANANEGPATPLSDEERRAVVARMRNRHGLRQEDTSEEHRALDARLRRKRGAVPEEDTSGEYHELAAQLRRKRRGY
jgi:hypothetical protein